MTHIKKHISLFGLFLGCVIFIRLIREYSVGVLLVQEGDAISRRCGRVSRFTGIQSNGKTTRSYAKSGCTRTIADNNTAFWARVTSFANSRHLYPAEFCVEDVLRRLATAEVAAAQSFSRDDPDVNFGQTHVGGHVDFGSTHKWLLHLDGGQLVIFKPMW